MKKKFSTAWMGSSQIRKQRKYRYNAPLHIRQKFMSANLSEDLRKKYGKKSLEVRKGDSVKIMRGEFFKKTGKISMVDLKKTRVAIEGIQKQKKDGTKFNVYFHPSNLQIMEVVEDKRRNLKKEVKEKAKKENKQEKK